MQFMCLVAYGGQRWTDVNETKQIYPLMFLMFLLYVLLMRRILTIKPLGLCFSQTIDVQKSLGQFVEVDNRMTMAKNIGTL